MTIRDKIRKAVAADPRTQAAIAVAAGICPPNLCDYLAGRGDLRVESVERLFSTLGIVVSQKKSRHASRVKSKA